MLVFYENKLYSEIKIYDQKTAVATTNHNLLF